MRMTLKASTTTLLAALLLPATGALPSGAAFAQTAPAAAAASPDAAPTDAATHAGEPHRHLTAAERKARVEQRISWLHDRLEITPDQQAAWDSFAGVMRDNANRMEASFDKRGASLEHMNAADNMQSYADTAVQHAQDIQRLAVAFQSLYGKLSPQQQAVADTMFRNREAMHGRR